MKKAIMLYLILSPALAFAQFPAPDSFQVNVNYIHLDESDWCDNQLVQGPTYCNFFSWQAPDTNNTPATLTGYRIYKDSEFFLATANTEADTGGGYMHVNFYVTAVYENPAGESAPSNAVYIGDLPIGTEEVYRNQKIGIGFDLSHRILLIGGAEYAQNLQVYNMQGGRMLFTDAVSANQRLDGLPAGTYTIVIQDKSGGMHCKMMVIGL